MGARRRIALYGGSFNPLHVGHANLAGLIVEGCRVNELWVLLSPHNPLKPAADLLADDARLTLARLGVEGMEGVKVSDFECHLPRPSYMVNTLAALRAEYANVDFVLVVGADNWVHFNDWYHADEIMARHDIIVYPRAGYDIDPTTLPPRVELLEAPLFDVSSTEIRHAIATDPHYDGRHLAPKVWDMIRANGWYGYGRAATKQ